MAHTVSFDVIVHGDTTPEEAITAAKNYLSQYSSAPTETIKIHRGPDSFEVEVTLDMVKAVTGQVNYDG